MGKFRTSVRGAEPRHRETRHRVQRRKRRARGWSRCDDRPEDVGHHNGQAADFEKSGFESLHARGVRVGLRGVDGEKK